MQHDTPVRTHLSCNLHATSRAVKPWPGMRVPYSHTTSRSLRESVSPTTNGNAFYSDWALAEWVLSWSGAECDIVSAFYLAVPRPQSGIHGTTPLACSALLLPLRE